MGAHGERTGAKCGWKPSLLHKNEMNHNKSVASAAAGSELKE
jgi:hypothetical protein